MGVAMWAPRMLSTTVLRWCLVIVAACTVVSVSIFLHGAMAGEQGELMRVDRLHLLMADDAARVRSVAASLVGLGTLSTRRKDDSFDFDRRLHGSSSACVDTPGWTNRPGPGYDCLHYEHHKWCISGKPEHGHEHIFGAKFGHPEQNCCSCGKMESSALDIRRLGIAAAKAAGAWSALEREATVARKDAERKMKEWRLLLQAARPQKDKTKLLCCDPIGDYRPRYADMLAHTRALLAIRCVHKHVSRHSEWEERANPTKRPMPQVCDDSSVPKIKKWLQTVRDRARWGEKVVSDWSIFSGVR